MYLFHLYNKLLYYIIIEVKTCDKKYENLKIDIINI